MDTPALSQTRPAPASKTDWITFASVVSCAAVVALHANGCFWTFSATARWWATANVIESACYFAVPVFFMISGATLLEFYDRYSLREYFRRRVVKTLVPYLFWSLFNVVYSVATGSVAASDVTIGWLLDGLGGGRSPASTGFSSRSSASTFRCRFSRPCGTTYGGPSIPTWPSRGSFSAACCRF